MTDDQVISYATQRRASGIDTKTIGNELLAQGATAPQLRRLIGKNAKSSYTDTGITAGTTVEEVDRTRQNNGENEPDESGDIFENKIFGHDIFRSKLLSFEPNMSLAVASTYLLGAGDELIVDVYGASASSKKLKVAPDGTVTIPKIGPVGVSGLTVDQAQSRIRGVMGKHYSNASIKVTVGQTRTISVNVMGEVLTPGTYTLSAFATVFHALYMAGGITDTGTLRDVKVARNGRVISTVDVYEYIISGRLAGNVKLQDNDVIIVGSYENLVTINGSIKRPMIYEMKKDESLQSLFRFSGGFTGDAYSKSVTVKRKAGSRLSLYTVDEFDFTNFTLNDQDSVLVRINEQRYENIITVNGAVKRPGLYGLNTVKTVRELIEAAGGLQEDAIKNRAVITRTNDDRTLKTITVDLAGIVNGTAADITLENEDILTIASQVRLNEERKMTIAGEVWNPGTYNYAENTTIEDLITMAGGLRESASLLNVEVSRRIIDQEAATDSIIKCETFTFNLSKNLSIEGQNDFTLKPYDRVSIRRSPIYENQNSITVSGEVVFAGNYALTNNNVRLSDIIKRAGGLKKEASALNARLVRKLDEAERERARQLVMMGENSSDSIRVDTINIYKPYTVGINLEKALANPGGNEDLVLRDGDEIIVPQIINTVKISGEVLYPNNVTFIKGKRSRYYINQAGGYTKRSMRKRAYIVYANGQVSKVSEGKIEPGCEIVVPTKEEKNNSENAMRWISILTSFATTAAVIVSAIK